MYDQIYENQILNWLEQRVGVEHFSPGLDRLRPLFDPLAKRFLQQGVKIVTIAGSNGKGECAHALANLLDQGGISYTMWTSPHILTIRERFQHQGKLISYPELFSTIKEGYLEATNQGVVLSFYELLFYVFCRWSLDQNRSWAIFEVGLGGRLDAVNLFNANLVAVTSISREHQEILGDSFRSILQEKLGICRQEVPVTTTLELGYLRVITKKYCKRHNIPWRDLFESSLLHYCDNFSVRNRALAQVLFGQICDLPLPKERRELLAAVEESSAHYQGRMESWSWQQRECLFIGAHNLDGLRKQEQLIKSDPRSNKIDHLIFSLSRRPQKELTNCIKQIAFSTGLAKRIVITSFVHARSEDHQVLQTISQQYAPFLEFSYDYASYLQQHSRPGERILFTGSYYFIGEVQKFMLQAPATN
ncbi:MAG: hypothetical protein HN353_09255 [Bdellovibrionales bacterium]|jgi:dihydrofolate synthase / folylpolyglutamate synthase|nr:hypothetical protein [Bdellovibrionales bacterium]MBT3527319.1 hypothetical protein [Bdellovibrionales bacterium]MBT7668511.1 hypothetical protein [Bdellovibrionales bacterium]MBT7766475.1 hypothetical protein [Bdellovibrionales bacterium]